MKIKSKIVLACLLLSSACFARQAYVVRCDVGGTIVATAGFSSTNKVEGSFPGCSVTVNIHSAGLASIFSDNSGTSLANPFTTSTQTGYGVFYADNGHYDVTLSGAGIVVPIVIPDILLNDPASQLGCSALPALTGDITSAGGTCATVLPNISSAGTGLKTTINTKGQVTSVATAASTDLSDTTIIARLNATANFGANSISGGAITGTAGTFTSVTNSGNETISGTLTVTGALTSGPFLSNRIEGVRYCDQFSGADIGAKCNNAIADFPANTCGVIFIPAGTYSFSTTLQLPVTGTSLGCLLEGAGYAESPGSGATSENATLLNYTGSGVAIDQTVTNASFANQTGASVRDLTVQCSGCTAGSTGIKFGGSHGYSFYNVGAQNFTGAGGKGIWVRNSGATLFTERVNGINLHFSNNTSGLFLDGTGSASNDHSVWYIWCDTFASQTCVAAANGVTLFGSYLLVNGNIQGAGAIGISVDATSTTSASTRIDWLAEASSGNPTRFSVANGGVFQATCGFCMSFGWVDSGTVNLQGFDGAVLKLQGNGDNFLATFQHTSFTANRAFIWPDTGGIIPPIQGGSGTVNKLPKFAGSVSNPSFVDSSLTDTGGTLTTTQNVFSISEGACGAGSANNDLVCAASANHRLQFNNNVSGFSTAAVFSDNLGVFAAGGAISPASITNNTGLQLFNTGTTCTTGAAVGSTCTTAAITLPSGYADTNYRGVCVGLSPTNVPTLVTITKSNTTFTITIAALTAAAATYASFDCHFEHN